MVNLKNFKFTTNGFYLMIIAVLVIIILLQKGCSPKVPCPDGGEPITTVKIDTEYVDKVVVKPVYKPGETQYLPGLIDTITTPIDTTAILKDYLATRIYSDTLKIDSIGFVYVSDTVSKNEIQARSFVANYKIPIIKETITTVIPPKPKNQLYIGAEGIGSKREPISYFGSTLVLKTKKDAMYTAGAGYSLNQGFSLKAGVLWKIKLK